VEPQIITAFDFAGRHNAGIKEAQQRIQTGGGYKDLSTICIVPTRGGASLSPKWVSSMIALVKPMNQKYIGPVFFTGFEVGEAYNKAVKMIQETEQLKNFKFMLTWEDDVIPQPDALLKLYEAQEATNADITGALYWVKGEGGAPMTYGDASDPNINYRPVVPKGEVQKVYGTGMGFTLFKLDQFRDKVKGPDWFETVAKWDPSTGIQCATQDLEYCNKLNTAGGKVVVAPEAKAAHYDHTTDILW
jgi:hypothetical protein